jgi:uncharacterized protein (DUF4415 family)
MGLVAAFLARAWFKAAGEDYQTRINAALRAYMESHSRS